jgi:hypothetical protein
MEHNATNPTVVMKAPAASLRFSLVIGAPQFGRRQSMMPEALTLTPMLNRQADFD